MACAGGCGEVYVDEYINHPPVCDPCGTCDSCNGSCGADYVGGCGCQPDRPIFQWISRFWGIPYNAVNCGNCGAQGCSHCGGGCRTCQAGEREMTGHSHNTYMQESVPAESYDGALQAVPRNRTPAPKAQPQAAPEAEANPEVVEPAPEKLETAVPRAAAKVSRLAPAQRRQTSSRLVTTPE